MSSRVIEPATIAYSCDMCGEETLDRKLPTGWAYLTFEPGHIHKLACEACGPLLYAIVRGDYLPAACDAVMHMAERERDMNSPGCLCCLKYGGNIVDTYQALAAEGKGQIDTDAQMMELKLELCSKCVLRSVALVYIGDSPITAEVPAKEGLDS